jgi:C4-type Zn-finger protein
MENDEDIICALCGGIMRSRSAIVDVGVPEGADRFEWVCQNCGHKRADIEVRERTKLDESVRTDKNPT